MRFAKIVVPAVLATVSVSAVAASNLYEREAKKELRACVNDAREPGYEVVAQTTVLSACFAGGFITDVELYKVPTCHQEPCGRPAAELVGAVQFGCADEVQWAECTAEVPQFCYEIYAPVCGTDGETYSNDCYAAQAGVDVAYDGACGSTF